MAVLLFVPLAPRPSSAAVEPVVPANVQAAAIIRILEYDRGLRTWTGGALTVGVVARDGRAVSELGGALAGRDVQGIPVKVVEHAYRDSTALDGWIGDNGVRLVYVASDLSGESPAVINASAALKRPTFAPTRAQFDRGATLGLVVHEGRPRVLVNLPSSRAAGMNLDPKLLELSEVVR